jgi:hypothetical protein
MAMRRATRGADAIADLHGRLEADPALAKLISAEYDRLVLGFKIRMLREERGLNQTAELRCSPWTARPTAAWRRERWRRTEESAEIDSEPVAQPRKCGERDVGRSTFDSLIDLHSHPAAVVGGILLAPLPRLSELPDVRGQARLQATIGMAAVLRSSVGLRLPHARGDRRTRVSNRPQR